ncbi:MAG: SPOR domain-containing protein [Flavobacteriales bacterium]|nr:SPOR domain-containing protein [Flavobacteriales bacterium]
MTHRFLFLLSIVFAGGLLAQDPPPVRYFEPFKGERSSIPLDTPVTSDLPAGQVIFHSDPQVERLMQQYKDLDHPQPGFRVQIFLGERKAAEDTKRTFLQRNPDIPAYQSWLAPNWRLRVGDCRTRLEAERLLRDLRTTYPGSYIVPDEIEMPLLPR